MYLVSKDEMSQSKEAKNKALVLKAFDTLFNKRDYAAAERFWSANYIQHSAHIEPGREGLFNLIKSLPSTLKYEPGVIVAEGDFVIVHGRFSGDGHGPRNWIAADVVRIADDVLTEHWDVLQDEATRAESKSGLPMVWRQLRGLSLGRERPGEPGVCPSVSGPLCWARCSRGSDPVGCVRSPTNHPVTSRFLASSVDMAMFPKLLA